MVANTLNKESRRPIRGGPPAWDLVEELTTPHRKHFRCYVPLNKASDMD